MTHYEKKNKRHLIAFALVIAMSFCTGAYLIGVVFAQSMATIKQNPVEVGVPPPQADSPLLIKVDSIDNSEKAYQIINYSAFNAGSKKIVAIVMELNNSNSKGKVTTNFFNSFDAGKTIVSSISEERQNVRPDSKVFLNIDFVRFEDGTSWGKDSDHESENISAYFDGSERAISDVRKIFTEESPDALGKILTKEITSVDPTGMDQKESDTWQRGIVVGYRAKILTLRGVFEKSGREGVANRLGEINAIKPEDK